METLTEVETRLLVFVGRRARVTRRELADRQVERGVLRRRRGLEDARGYAKRCKRKRTTALDNLVLAGYVRRCWLRNGKPGPDPMVYELTKHGRAFLRAHGNGGGVYVTVR